MDAKIAIIGYGSMGRMIFEKLLASSLVEPENMYLANRTFEKISALKEECGVNVCKTNKEAASNADIIFVCLRPGDIKAVLEEIGQTEIPMPDGGKWAEAGMVECLKCDIAWRVLDAHLQGEEVTRCRRPSSSSARSATGRSQTS